MGALFLGGYLYYIQVGRSEKAHYLLSGPGAESVQFSPSIQPPIPFEFSDVGVDLNSVDAEAILAFNPLNSQIYASANPDKQLPIASITKLISAEIIYDTYDSEQELVLENILPKEVEWGVGLKQGDSVKAGDALVAMMVGSYNDLAYLFAQNYPNGGYEGFVHEMNRRAALLGMKSTKFSNPAGLDAKDNYSTASDLMKLSSHFIRNSDLVSIVETVSYEFEILSADGTNRKASVYTTNNLLGSSPYIKGLKTGFTEEAQGCFVGYFVADDSDQLITIILGSRANRFEETVELTDQINVAYD